jgi:hypothetical protein
MDREREEEEGVSEGKRQEKIDIMEAMTQAKEMFESCIEKQGYQVGFFRLQMKVEFRDVTMEKTLEEIEWRDYS